MSRMKFLGPSKYHNKNLQPTTKLSKALLRLAPAEKPSLLKPYGVCSTAGHLRVRTAHPLLGKNRKAFAQRLIFPQKNAQPKRIGRVVYTGSIFGLSGFGGGRGFHKLLCYSPANKKAPGYPGAKFQYLFNFLICV